MQRKVLIIDDEVDLCVLVKAYLCKLGYAVCIAHTLSDGLQQLQLQQPDVLFLDNNLPDGTGWSRARQIHTQYPGLHIILISAIGAGHEFYQTHHFPFRILEKPILLGELEKTLEKGED